MTLLPPGAAGQPTRGRDTLEDNRISVTDPNDNTTRFAYDLDGLLVQLIEAGGQVTGFEYDEAHNQITMTDGLGTTTNTYDALNRLTSSTNHLGQMVDYAYDPASNRIALTYPDGRTVRYEVDANNRVNRVTPHHPLCRDYYGGRRNAEGLKGWRR